jgi:hypothetical protein
MEWVESRGDGRYRPNLHTNFHSTCLSPILLLACISSMVNESDQISRADYIPYTQSAARDTAVSPIREVQSPTSHITVFIGPPFWSTAGCQGRRDEAGEEHRLVL